MDVNDYYLNWPGALWVNFKNPKVFHSIEVSSGTYWLFLIIFGNKAAKHPLQVGVHPDTDPDYTVTVTSGGSTSPPASPTSTVVYSDPNGPTIHPAA